jgi:membrane-associated phospholipid phosphatase
VAPLAIMGAFYVVAVGWGEGREIDDAVRPDEEDDTVWRAVFAVAVQSLRAPTFLLAAAIAVLLARARGGDRLAFAVGALLLGANVTEAGLELALGRLDLLGGESERALGVGFFPSGHATAAMSLALAAVLMAPSARRRLVASLAAAYAAAVGVGLIVVDSHTPSDVIGGYLYSAAWAAAVIAVAALDVRPRAGPRLSPWLAPAAGAAVALLLLAVTALDPPAGGAVAFSLGSGVVTATAFAVTALRQRR